MYNPSCLLPINPNVHLNLLSNLGLYRTLCFGLTRQDVLSFSIFSTQAEHRYTKVNL